VIAIIAILAALVMSAVSRAQNSASKATDINNLHQIITALAIYCDNNHDRLPLPNWDNGGALADGKVHRGWLYLPDPTAVGANRYRVDTGSLWPFLRQSKVYFCPMDKPAVPRYSASVGAVIQRPQQISSYAINGAINGFMHLWNHPEILPPKLAQMRPSDCAFWETDERDPFYFNDGANYPREGVSTRHYQGGIEATFGGQVDYVRFTDWYKDVAFPGKNRLWCYPNSADGGNPESPGHGP
ncbi:MAG: hypothetical protein KGR98_08190, partial [Verrucomicrobia bacterium]|nr:hypothetical protein [Verrucomicrobiota bacterium]